MGNPKHPAPGDLVIDASDLTNVVDHPSDTASSLRKVRSGYDVAVKTLLNLAAPMLKRAGIDPTQIDTLKEAFGDYTYITGELVPAVEKLLEILKETAQDRANTMALVIEESCSQTRVRAKKDPDKASLLGAMEPVLNYQTEAAKKAVKTKIQKGQLKPKAPKTAKAKKNAAAKAAQQAAAQQPAAQQSPAQQPPATPPAGK